MTTSLGVVNPGDSLQRMRRASRQYTDERGRLFYAEADAISQQPIGEMRPVGWVAPWLPPQRFAKFRRDGELSFRWDYQSMADELAADVAAYYEQATKFALEHNLPVPDVGGIVDRRIAAVFGPAPLSPEIPMAADAGDRWLLGYPDAPRNDDLAAILRQGTISTGHDAIQVIKDRIAKRMGTFVPDSAPGTPEPFVPTPPEGLLTYREFVAEGRKNGMTMPDIALAWQAHKTNMQEPVDVSPALHEAVA